MTISLTLQQIIELSPQGNTIPIYKQLDNDILTPISAYLKIAKDTNYSFLFESILGGEKIGRYSFHNIGPRKILDKFKGDPLVDVETELKHVRPVTVAGLPDFTGITF
jgi:anthranilate synthase component 1